MSLAGDDDEPRTELDIGVKISSVGGEARVPAPVPMPSPVADEPSPADDEPQTMEPRTLDPRLGIRPLAAPPSRAPLPSVAEPEPDVHDEPSIQTVEARVVDAHKGVVEKVRKSPTIRGVGPLVPPDGAAAIAGGDDDELQDDELQDETEDETEDRTELDSRGVIAASLARVDEAPTATVTAVPKVERPAPPKAVVDEEDVTALDTSLLSGGLALAARAEAAKPAASPKPAVSPRTTASPKEAPPLKANPSVPPRPAPRVAKAAPQLVTHTLEMPRPAFVNASTPPADSARGPRGTAKIVSGAHAAPQASRDESSAVDTRSPRSQGTGGPSALTVTLLVLAAFVVGVLVTLFVVRRTPPSASDGASTPETAATSAERPQAAATPPAPLPSMTATPTASSTSSSTSSSTHKTPASFTSPPVRVPPKTPAPKSSTPMHL